VSNREKMQKLIGKMIQKLKKYKKTKTFKFAKMFKKFKKENTIFGKKEMKNPEIKSKKNISNKEEVDEEWVESDESKEFIEDPNIA